MKKIVSSLLIVSAFLLTACGSGNTNSSSASSAANSSTEKTSASSDANSGASEQEYTDPSQLKDSYDIIIVGAGGAGMAAAIQAKEAGANPVILEKMPIAGGNTLKSSGGMNASETKFQKEQGIEDSNDTFFEDTLKGGQETNDRDLLRY
nr:FAD-dependent oxidoreductase [Enterococcus sp.]